MKIFMPTGWEDSRIQMCTPGDGRCIAYAPYTAGWLVKVPEEAMKRKLAAHIQGVKKRGAAFNLFIDYMCFNNEEFTRKGFSRLTGMLDLFTASGLDSITVGSPYIFELIKKRFPQLSVGVSDEAYVDSPRRAQFWEDMGADFIILPASGVNKDFEVMITIRRGVSCELYIVVNSSSLNKYPYSDTYLQHSHQGGGGALDSPEYLLSRGTWVRPEDTGFYLSQGINGVKLLSEPANEEQFIRVVSAYRDKKYGGNIADLLSE